MMRVLKNRQVNKILHIITVVLVSIEIYNNKL